MKKYQPFKVDGHSQLSPYFRILDQHDSMQHNIDL